MGMATWWLMFDTYRAVNPCDHRPVAADENGRLPIHLAVLPGKLKQKTNMSFLSSVRL